MTLRDNRSRLQQWQLAERQRYLDELESLATRLRGDAERLHAEIAAADRPIPSGDRATVHNLFVRPLINRRDKLTRSIAELDAQIAETRAAVTAAQQEIRVYGEARVADILQRRRRARRHA